jgi:hypothetical protein
MRPHIRLKKITGYPEWHKKPFLLNRAEMANPYLVLAEFFARYDLSNIRISLRQWLDDTLQGTAEEAASHGYTHENVAKLVEAAWLIFEQTRQVKADEGFTKAASEDKNEEDAEEEGEKERRRFVKCVTFPASLKKSPCCLHEVGICSNSLRLSGRNHPPLAKDSPYSSLRPIR